MKQIERSVAPSKGGGRAGPEPRALDARQHPATRVLWRRKRGCRAAVALGAAAWPPAQVVAPEEASVARQVVMVTTTTCRRVTRRALDRYHTPGPLLALSGPPAGPPAGRRAARAGAGLGRRTLRRRGPGIIYHCSRQLYCPSPFSRNLFLYLWPFPRSSPFILLFRLILPSFFPPVPLPSFSSSAISSPSSSSLSFTPLAVPSPPRVHFVCGRRPCVSASPHPFPPPAGRAAGEGPCHRRALGAAPSALGNSPPTALCFGKFSLEILTPPPLPLPHKSPQSFPKVLCLLSTSLLQVPPKFPVGPSPLFLPRCIPCTPRIPLKNLNSSPVFPGLPPRCPPAFPHPLPKPPNTPLLSPTFLQDHASPKTLYVLLHSPVFLSPACALHSPNFPQDPSRPSPCPLGRAAPERRATKSGFLLRES
ncbi:hypothetical protein C7M84_008243 [Penaeus vannamei]|uniref:Uncharacterized protein n=1 Tax=Penaeus vannamei TaxID=6689 RepID=A0A423TAC2_PENVA|nr:hypothetical protein C7M84_008243 [Penaeus vannamei]